MAYLWAALMLSITGAAQAQVVPNGNFASCSTAAGPIGASVVAGGVLTVSRYSVTYGANPSPDVCPGWTFTKGSSTVYLSVVTANTSAGNPPAVGTKAIWLNEEVSTASTTVTGLIPGQTYALSVDAWSDDVVAATALDVDFGGSKGTLSLAAGSGQQTTSVELCAKATTASLVLAEGGATGSSPIFTNVRVVDAKKPCAGMFTLGGTLSGLASGQTVVLLNNAGNPITLGADGTFTFPGTLNDGGTYAVTVGTQPSGQVCTVTRGGGTISGANVTDVLVTCTQSRFTVGGTLSGLAAGQSVVLLNNAGDPVTLNADGTFTFPAAVNDASAYAVTVGTQPKGQVCTVTRGSGSVAGANVTNVLVTCTAAEVAVAPVPVDSPWMLLLATLGVAGLAARRRRTRH